jgi:hypothetical protein
MTDKQTPMRVRITGRWASVHKVVTRQKAQVVPQREDGQRIRFAKRDARG